MLRRIGLLFVTDVSGQNIGSVSKGQAVQVLRPCLRRRVIAEGKEIKPYSLLAKNMTWQLELFNSRFHTFSACLPAIYSLGLRNVFS
jgi:hypothetical protein